MPHRNPIIPRRPMILWHFDTIVIISCFCILSPLCVSNRHILMLAGFLWQWHQPLQAEGSLPQFSIESITASSTTRLRAWDEQMSSSCPRPYSGFPRPSLYSASFIHFICPCISDVVSRLNNISPLHRCHVSFPLNHSSCHWASSMAIHCVRKSCE